MLQFIPAEQPLTQPLAPNTSIWQLVFQQRKLLVEYSTAGHMQLPSPESLQAIEFTPLRQHYLGSLNSVPCYAIEIDTLPVLPVHLRLESLRTLAVHIDINSFEVAGRAFQVLEWDRNHQFCSRCGTPLPAVTWGSVERVKRCQHCQLNHYPRVTPAVIMLIRREHEVLLSRSPHFKPGLYSVQAGFVEAGESLEQAVVREVQEEVGLQIKNLRYFGSQSWPFPHSLMVAFTADYASGDLRVNLTELEDAGWYQADNLPLLPSSLSISHHLITDFIHSV